MESNISCRHRYGFEVGGRKSGAKRRKIFLMVPLILCYDPHLRGHNTKLGRPKNCENLQNWGGTVENIETDNNVNVKQCYKKG